MMDPLRSIGLLSRISGDEFVLSGSCFAFRSPRYFITAQHCIDDVTAEYAIAIPRLSIGAKVGRVIRHPSADIAICVLEGAGSEWVGTEGEVPQAIQPFWGNVKNYGLGEEFMTFGFPAETPFINSAIAAERVFVGHFQRFMSYRRDQYSYLGGELSIPCPAGLSGAPLFRRGAPVMITGIVTENVEVSTQLHEEESVTHRGQTQLFTYRRVITYGVALMLSGVQEWIDEHVPQFKHDDR
jgi:hypothetical protein